MRLPSSRVSLLLTVLLPAALLAPPAIQGQTSDPRDLVVMLEWTDYLGFEHRGAGLILDASSGQTLIATAGHNLIDQDEGHPVQDLTVEFRSRPGTRVPGHIIYRDPTYDLGFLRVQGDNSADDLEAGQLQVLGSVADGDLTVYIVGYGGGVPWEHSVFPSPARLASPTELSIESSGLIPGQSGGAVFDRDWSLVGMVYETEGGVATALPIDAILAVARQNRFGVGLSASEEGRRQRARRALTSRGIPVTADGLADALASADSQALQLFLDAGLDASLISEALSRPVRDQKSAAELFFERGRSGAATAEWLRRAVDLGLDPNMTVSGSRYERIGLLTVALAAGSEESALALLEAGASPHSYQELWFSRAPTPSFLFPFNALLNSNLFDLIEKRRLLQAFLENGGLIPSLVPVQQSGGFQASALRALETWGDQLQDFEISPNDPEELGQSRVCRQASMDGEFDWCTMARPMPRQIYRNTGSYNDVHAMEIVGLLNVVDDKAYFMGREVWTYRGVIDVVEVSRDMRAWRVYRYQAPAAGMGLCPEENGYRPDDCWRRIDMTFDPTASTVLVEGFYQYLVSYERSRPNSPPGLDQQVAGGFAVRAPAPVRLSRPR